MSESNNNNSKKRPVLRNTQTRAELRSDASAGQRPAVSAGQHDAGAQNNANRSAAGRPAIAKTESGAAGDGAQPQIASDTPARKAGVSEVDFTTIKGFLDSLGDLQTGLDVDADASDSQASMATQPAAREGGGSEAQEQQPAGSSTNAVPPPAPTAGTDRERLGLEQNLASIRLEDTDYRRIGHRNNDDKPIATIIKGGIAL